MTEEQQLLAMSEAEYMNDVQQNYFRRLLIREKENIFQHIAYLKEQLHRGDAGGDEGDKALREEELRLLLRQIDRQSRLMPKFDAALQRLRNGEYGYCIDTGEPIGLKRLMLRPTAELSIDAKLKREIIEAQYRK